MKPTLIKRKLWLNYAKFRRHIWDMGIRERKKKLQKQYKRGPQLMHESKGINLPIMPHSVALKMETNIAEIKNKLME